MMSGKIKNLLARAAYGKDPKHLTISASSWSLMTWDEDEVKLENGPRLLETLDKLRGEIIQDLEAGKMTTARPISAQVLVPRFPNMKKPIPNIMTTAGMAEMAKRSTGETTTTNTHHGIGTGTTTETVADTTLESEDIRKVIGSRSVSGTVERYATAFHSSDFTGLPKDITEAGIFTAATDGILIVRVTSDAETMSSGRVLTVGTNITHENGTV